MWVTPRRLMPESDSPCRIAVTMWNVADMPSPFSQFWVASPRSPPKKQKLEVRNGGARTVAPSGPAWSAIQ